MKKVFIIEDDSVVLYALKAKLSHAGMDVLTSEGNEETKDLMLMIRKEKPDYIILDLILPNIDGSDILREIKSEISGWRMPVFIFSNLSDNDTKERCQNLGADYFFAKKEFNIDEFVEKFLKIINNLDKIHS